MIEHEIDPECGHYEHPEHQRLQQLDKCTITCERTNTLAFCCPQRRICIDGCFFFLLFSLQKLSESDGAGVGAILSDRSGWD